VPGANLVTNLCILFDQNFVGLSISDGYIATGSETNEVCILSLHQLFFAEFGRYSSTQNQALAQGYVCIVHSQLA
jgi:hypothetical protein